jgi:hypothetical protein
MMGLRDRKYQLRPVSYTVSGNSSFSPSKLGDNMVTEREAWLKLTVEDPIEPDLICPSKRYPGDMLDFRKKIRGHNGIVFLKWHHNLV